MGFLKNLFGTGNTKESAENLAVIDTEKNTVYAPLSGKAITLSAIGDGVFSEGVLGQGCGIIPSEETVYAPFDGTVVQITDTKHAVGLLSNDGIELLIHVGMDTVSMNGKGFTMHVSENDKVVCGQKLLSFSKKAIAEAGYSDTTAIIVTNTDSYTSIDTYKDGEISHQEKLLYVK